MRMARKKSPSSSGARRADGTFQKGVSGNPTGLPKVIPLQDGAVRKIKNVNVRDGWANFFTGHGIAGRDKRTGGFFQADTLTWDQMLEIARGDDIAKRACEIVPNEAFRQGWDLTITEGDDNEDEDDRVQDITDVLTKLGAEDAIRIALIWERIYGGAAVLIGVNDGQKDLSKPLNMDNVKSIDWLTPIEPRELMPVYAYADPYEPKFGQPEVYRFTPRSQFPSKDGFVAPGAVDIHESRLLVFHGEKMSRYISNNMGGWGDSIFVPMYKILRDFNMTWAGAGAIVMDFAAAVYKFKNLWETLASDDAGEFQNRIATMELTKSQINATVIDAEDEYERTSTSVAGLPDLLDKFAARLAAACGMPLTLLFGTSPGGMNATGDSDIRFFYDKVAQYQDKHISPQFKKLIQIIMRCEGMDEPDKWDITFRPLWQESAKDKAATMMSQSSADVAWITAGVLSAEEVASAHWGSGKYNPDISVDFDARERQEQAAAAPVSQADLDAVNPDSPNYKGSQLDPNSTHYVAPPQGVDPANPTATVGKPKPSPFGRTDVRENDPRAWRRKIRAAQGNPSDRTGRNTPGLRSDVRLDTEGLFVYRDDNGVLRELRPATEVFERLDYSPDQERDENGRFAGGGSAEALATSAKANGGFTFNPHNGSSPDAGYSVAIHGDRERKLVGKEAITADAIKNYIKDNHDVLLRDPQAHLGGWYNHEDDTWYLDVPHVEKDLSVAASLGHDNKQLGIYDLKRGETINANEYPDAIAKTGRFHGRTDSRKAGQGTGHHHEPSDFNARGDGRGYESASQADPGRTRSDGRLDHIEKRGSKYVVVSEDRSKDLGEYDSHEEAAKRLGQIEYFKHQDSDDEARDEHGRWTSGGGGGSSPSPKGGSNPSSWKGGAEGYQSTLEAFKHDGKWNPDRRQMHEAFAKQVTQGVAQCKPGEHTVYMTGGGPASGKTSGLLMNPGAGIPDKSHAVFVSADEAKEKIPEFQAGIRAKDPNAGGFVHEESSAMSQLAFNRAMESKQNIVYDSTADSGIEKITKSVQEMRNQGANHVVTNYATVDIDEALRRAKNRGEQTGRFVPTDVLVANHQAVSKTMLDAMDKGIFDSENIWDTSGHIPVLVASYNRVDGKQIHDQVAYAKLLKRAGRV